MFSDHRQTTTNTKPSALRTSPTTTTSPTANQRKMFHLQHFIVILVLFVSFADVTLLLVPLAIALSDVGASIVRRVLALGGYKRMSDKAATARLTRDKLREKRGVDFLGQLLSKAERNRILSLSATQVLAEMHAGRVSCENVMKTCIAQAQQCAASFNAVTQEPFEEALAAARVVDRRIAAGESLRPLEGLPISIKDSYDQKGLLPASA
jgi:hypothetical protein